MADIFVKLGPMTYNSDTNKVALKYAVKAEETMMNAAKAAFKNARGFTLDQASDPKSGFQLRVKLTEIVFGTYQGQPSVKAKFTGELLRYPKELVLSTSLVGSGYADRSSPEGSSVPCAAPMAMRR